MSRFSISDFKSELARSGGPTRGHLFRCAIYEPNFFGDANRLHFLCQSTAIPTQAVNPIEIKYHTRAVKIPGERTNAGMSLTFLNTGNYQYHQRFLQWHGTWSSYRTNARGVRDSRVTLTQDSQPFPTSPSYGRVVLEHYAEYSREWLLSVIGANIMPTFSRAPHQLLGTYVLEGVYPASVGGLSFSQSDDTFQTYAVEFQYQYMEFFGPITGTDVSTRIVDAQT